jgi:hypothetical protein
MQNKKNIIISIVVIAILALGINALISTKDEDSNKAGTLVSDYFVSTIQVKHQYKDGNHTYVGSLDLPSPCFSIDAYGTKNDDGGATIVINTPENKEDICAQVVTTKVFRVEILGDATMTVKGVLNGKDVQLNLFEVPADQDIDQFEINIKG